jgi:hypothetical protein
MEKITKKILVRYFEWIQISKNAFYFCSPAIVHFRIPTTKGLNFGRGVSLERDLKESFILADPYSCVMKDN